MINNILDVLTCMFDYLFKSAKEDSMHEVDDTELKTHLSKAGFDINRIDKALNWLENITNISPSRHTKSIFSTNDSMRIYSSEEKLKLNTKARGFLLFLENIGQLNANQRETVIEQAMYLNVDICLDDLKWITMMVLNNSSDDFSEKWLNSIIFTDDNDHTLQ